ncbi:hypothetical protein B0J12DRAFT_303347 [Macrophomina phaseolina]|uniref:Uncharacterized protein n=1 Tax=Macrophomina phaseolina TaxID=35725 RepID=A0ABQ8FXA9_9PEZI|nr:hypothetical protein B0J12DRAFT_303347 [Macrophomina phaseolina]
MSHLASSHRHKSQTPEPASDQSAGTPALWFTLSPYLRAPPSVLCCSICALARSPCCLPSLTPRGGRCGYVEVEESTRTDGRPRCSDVRSCVCVRGVLCVCVSPRFSTPNSRAFSTSPLSGIAPPLSGGEGGSQCVLSLPFRPFSFRASRRVPVADKSGFVRVGEGEGQGSQESTYSGCFGAHSEPGDMLDVDCSRWSLG